MVLFIGPLLNPRLDSMPVVSEKMRVAFRHKEARRFKKIEIENNGDLGVVRVLLLVDYTLHALE